MKLNKVLVGMLCCMICANSAVVVASSAKNINTDTSIINDINEVIHDSNENAQATLVESTTRHIDDISKEEYAKSNAIDEEEVIPALKVEDEGIDNTKGTDLSRKLDNIINDTDTDKMGDIDNISKNVPLQKGIDVTDKYMPKYVFLFIGDGMSYPEFQVTADYLGAINDSDYMKALPSLKREERTSIMKKPELLNFMNFSTAGSATTYNSSSFIPDSSSAITSIASGKKTHAGMLNVDETGKIKYETIAEKIHNQLGWKIGIISSVNINHATPAGFYAHQENRSNYYEIGKELIASNFEYFAGGGFRNPTDKDKSQEDLYQLAIKAGYNVVRNQIDAETLTSKSKKVILVDEHLADSDTMKYEIDRGQGEWALKDYVQKGIDLLEGEKGFFIMCEAGKIDWCCHSNDVKSAIRETMALADSVQVALDFAKKHPDETLILVTGDHETGGLTIGYGASEYNTYLPNLSSQTISFQKFIDEYETKYKKEQLSFKEALQDVEHLFGLKVLGNDDDLMVLSDKELDNLQTAYFTSIDSTANTKAVKAKYGSNDPFTVTITRILANKCGLNFSTSAHTGLPVAVFAKGVEEERFSGYYDNTMIYKKLANILGIK